MVSFRKNLIFLTTLFSFCYVLTAQEALKSIEEEYYDFLSLQGITNRPTLNYRTLSDSVWTFEENNISHSEKKKEGEESDSEKDKGSEKNAPHPSHPWQKNNLGKTFTLLNTEKENSNFFLKGIKQGISLRVYGPDWYNSYNTAAPYGQNDGALWQGKGYNTSLTAGARLEGYGFEMTLKPQVCFSQNLEFDLIYNDLIKSNHAYPNEYSYFWKGNIDLPQRFGDSSFWTFDWGDTEIRYSWYSLTFGFGTQAIWLGHAHLNPMLGSNNSPTFPKFDIGMRRQKIVIPGLNWYLGDIEGRVWMGQLSESDYFDYDSSNDKRQLTGFAVAYSPSFIPGLTLGLNKVCINRWDDFSAKYLNPFYSTNDQEIPEDQKMSFTVDWIFPKVGFEVYGEIGKDDNSTQKLANPFHTVIYTLGAKKTFTLWKKNNIFGEFLFEWNNFEASQDFQMQWKYMGYYAHGGISQGYTQKGQIIGAGTGYFGNSQYLGFRVYNPYGNVILYYHRHCPDNNYINEMTVGNSYTAGSEIYKKYWANYNAYRTIGGELLYFATKSLSINAGFSASWINFPNYTKEEVGKFNYHITLGCKYQI